MKYIKEFENYKDELGEKLYSACFYGDWKQARELIKLGANPDCTSDFGISPLMQVSSCPNEQSIGVNPNTIKAWKDRYSLDIIRKLIDAGADWCIESESGDTFMSMLEWRHREDAEIIKKEYPIKYDEYLMKMQAKKYNL